MPFILPTPQATHQIASSTNRGTFGGISNLVVKSGGNLPITASASQCINDTASSATGAPAGVAFGINGQDATSFVDGTTEAKVFLWSLQFNAPNRIQSTTLANGGSRFRLCSGSSPTSNYKEYYIGGNDTPFCSSQAGAVTMCIDLSDTSNDASAGSFNLSQVSAYAHLSVRFDLVGGSSVQTFFQRSFLFTTSRNSSNIPKFTGTSSFDDAITTVLGTSYTNKIGSWVTKSGNSIFLPCPFQIGDGSTATVFNDNGVAIVSPGSNQPGQENFRLSDSAMRVYSELRDNAADSITLSGSYSWGTAASWNFDTSNASTINIDGAVFSGMGNFRVGSSVTGAATFSLAAGSNVKIVNNPDLTGSRINGSIDLTTGTLTSFTNITVTGTLKFTVAGTYTLNSCNINSVTNTSGGTVNIINDQSTITTNSGPNINITNAATTLSLTGIKPGTEVRIYEAGTTTEVAGQEVVNSGTFSASISVSSVDVRLLSTNYLFLVISAVDTTANASLPIQQILDRQYRND